MPAPVAAAVYVVVVRAGAWLAPHLYELVMGASVAGAGATAARSLPGGLRAVNNLGAGGKARAIAADVSMDGLTNIYAVRTADGVGDATHIVLQTRDASVAQRIAAQAQSSKAYCGNVCSTTADRFGDVNLPGFRASAGGLAEDIVEVALAGLGATGSGAQKVFKGNERIMSIAQLLPLRSR